MKSPPPTKSGGIMFEFQSIGDVIVPTTGAKDRDDDDATMVVASRAGEKI